MDMLRRFDLDLYHADDVLPSTRIWIDAESEPSAGSVPDPPEVTRSTTSLWELACDLLDEFGHGL
jgi:hypothetical protein